MLWWNKADCIKPPMLVIAKAGGWCSSEDVSHGHFPAPAECFTRALCKSLAVTANASVTHVQSPATTCVTASRAAEASGGPASHSTGTFDPLCLLSLPGFVCWLWPVLVTYLPHTWCFSTSSRGVSFVQYRTAFCSAKVPCFYTCLHVGVLETFRQFSSSLEGPS